jgi:hypothetical protein
LQHRDYQAFSICCASSHPKIYYEITQDLDILRAFMRCSFMSEDGSDDDGDDGSGLGSSPICPLVASFNA